VRTIGVYSQGPVVIVFTNKRKLKKLNKKQKEFITASMLSHAKPYQPWYLVL